MPGLWLLPEHKNGPINVLVGEIPERSGADEADILPYYKRVKKQRRPHYGKNAHADAIKPGHEERRTAHMKRHGNLFCRIADIDNIRLAHKKARRGKRKYKEVQKIDAGPEPYFAELYARLNAGEYTTSPYQIIHKNTSGKDRVIFKLPYYPDRIVHHCIMNVLEPIWAGVLIRDTYSSIKDRGVHDGVKRVKRFLKDEPGTRYCLKIDVKKFYPSVDHAVLQQILRRKIKCKLTLALLDEIITSAPGLPIGNYLSQYFGNIYMSGFDHWCKEALGLRFYARYCDDIVVFSDSKDHLHTVFEGMQTYMRQNLRLTLNANHQVFPTRVRGVDFLGYRFFGDYTLIRKRIAQKFKRRLRQVTDKEVKMSKISIRSSVMSYKGWFAYADGYDLWNKYATDEVLKSVEIQKTKLSDKVSKIIR